MKRLILIMLFCISNRAIGQINNKKIETVKTLPENTGIPFKGKSKSSALWHGRNIVKSSVFLTGAREMRYKPHQKFWQICIMPDLNGFRLSLKFSSTGAFLLCLMAGKTGKFAKKHKSFKVIIRARQNRCLII